MLRKVTTVKVQRWITVMLDGRVEIERGGVTRRTHVAV